MTGDTSAVGRPTPEPEPLQKQGIAEGVSIAAACMLIILSAVSILQGISAVAHDDLYVVGVEYVYEFDTTAWGWIHIVLGIIALLCGIGLVTGATWARYASVVIAGLVIIANFLSLPYYPAWSIVVIALSVVVIWGVTTWHPDR